MTHSPAHPIGVLVAQLGTPDAPTPGALRAYLRQFLSDRRVIDYPPALWQPLLRGVILNVRPR
ncbi:MAG: ferrochelatase, partial [Anaerolineae bacterium]|nr:ferrochelatase [Anaerolineae bacterium]